MRWLMLLCALLLTVGGCQDNGGAVSVRWYIQDLTTGELMNPRDHNGPGGSCVFDEPDMSTLRSWSIAKIKLVIADVIDASPDSKEILSPCDSRVVFDCSQAEATTPFSLPTGTFAMSLQAIVTECGSEAGSGSVQTVTPAPAVRTIKRAEVVNLDVVQIGVHPLPTVPLNPADLSVPDAGPIK
jgi:hypothetical protein